MNDDSCKIIIFSWGEMVNLLMDALVIRLNKISINQLLIRLNSYHFPNQLTTVKESVISSDPPCKDGNTWFTMVPLKDLSDQVWIRTSCICLWKLLFWNVLSLVTCAFLAYMKDWNFQVRKTTVSSIFFIRIRLQGNSCKSDIDIFVWRVTWNYAYSVPLIV